MDHWNATTIDQRGKQGQGQPSLVREQMESPNIEQGVSPCSGSAAHGYHLYTPIAICAIPFTGIRLPPKKMADFSIHENVMQIPLAGESGLNRYTVTYSFYSACMEYFGTKLCLCFITPDLTREVYNR